MDLMVEAGFDKVFVGLETPAEESLAECNKFQNKERDMVAAVKKIQNHGLQVLGGFIVGFDSDPPNIFETQINFIQRLGVVTAMVGLLTALPKTRLYNRLKAEGRLLRSSTGNNTDLSLYGWLATGKKPCAVNAGTEMRSEFGQIPDGGGFYARWFF